MDSKVVEVAFTDTTLTTLYALLSLIFSLHNNPGRRERRGLEQLHAVCKTSEVLIREGTKIRTWHRLLLLLAV